MDGGRNRNPPIFSVKKKRFKNECFLTLLYDEWKPVSLNKLKFCRRGGKKASFCVKKEAFHEIMLRKSGTESHNIRAAATCTSIKRSSPSLGPVLFHDSFVYHLEAGCDLLMQMDLFRFGASTRSRIA